MIIHAEVQIPLAPDRMGFSHTVVSRSKRFRARPLLALAPGLMLAACGERRMMRTATAWPTQRRGEKP
jgi:hypothetical protein